MGEGPVFVLVRPQMGENIGAAARAMWNFGLDEMRLVAPRDGWPNERAVALASGATRVLDQVRVAADVAGAVADLSTLYATTARRRELRKPVLSPEEAMREARVRIAAGERVGVLFGPERAGLETDDLVAAQAIVSVDVNPAFPSLNVAQCVLLLGHEWRRAVASPRGPDPDGPLPPGERRASLGEVGRFADDLVARLEAEGYFWPEHRRAVMEATLRNILAKSPLSEGELRTLWGVVRALGEGRRRGAGPA